MVDWNPVNRMVPPGYGGGISQFFRPRGGPITAPGWPAPGPMVRPAMNWRGMIGGGGGDWMAQDNPYGQPFMPGSGQPVPQQVWTHGGGARVLPVDGQMPMRRDMPPPPAQSRALAPPQQRTSEAQFAYGTGGYNPFAVSPLPRFAEGTPAQNPYAAGSDQYREWENSSYLANRYPYEIQMPEANPSNPFMWNQTRGFIGGRATQGGPGNMGGMSRWGNWRDLFGSQTGGTDSTGGGTGTGGTGTGTGTGGGAGTGAGGATGGGSTGAGAGIGNGNPFGVIDYGSEAWQNSPAVKWASNLMSEGDYYTLPSGDISVPKLGVTLPALNRLNWRKLMMMQRDDPDGFALLDSAFKAANIPLSSVMNRLKAFAPLGTAYESSLVET